MLGGIVFGSRRWDLPLARQVMLLSGVLGLVLVPAPFVGTVPLLAVTTFVAGAAVAPALIANFSLTERLVPARLLTEGLTWTNSGLALGFSAGTTLGGIVIDSRGTTWAFVLPIVSASVAFLVAVAGQRVLLRASLDQPQPGPAVAWNTDPLPGPGPSAVIDDPRRPDGSASRTS
jgi:MFS family permease